MLNFIYYPISWIMWVWHWLFDAVLPNSPGWNGIAWSLSVIFLVFTLRAILYKPFVKQIRTTKKMQEVGPQMQAIRKKYANDRVKMTEEMQKLQKENGFNPLLGCLPMLMQVPVFIGLFHVLRSFNRMGGGTAMPFGHPSSPMTAEQTRSTGNYAFSPELVENFLDSRLFGVPLSSYISEPVDQFQAFVQKGAEVDFTRVEIIIVAVPLMILSAIATHMNSRASVARQSPEAAENPQTRIMNKLALYVFPIGILASGFIFPIAILLYWVANNAWTYGQQHLVFGRIEQEENHEREIREEKRKAAAPRPGEKPLPGNFDPRKTMNRGFTALAEGKTADAGTEFNKVVRYGQRNADWKYRERNGLVQAAGQVARVSDDQELRAGTAATWVDAARNETKGDKPSLGALEDFLVLRRTQLVSWLNDGHNARLSTVMRDDSAQLSAYEQAWSDANPDSALPSFGKERRAEWARLASIGFFREGKYDDARTYARQAISVYSDLIDEAGDDKAARAQLGDVDTKLAQVRLISSAPAGKGLKRAFGGGGGDEARRTHDAKEALELLSGTPDETVASTWVQSPTDKNATEALISSVLTVSQEDPWISDTAADAPDAKTLQGGSPAQQKAKGQTGKAQPKNQARKGGARSGSKKKRR